MTIAAWLLSAVLSADAASASARVAEGTNDFRRRMGLAALHREARLDGAATAFAQFMARSGKYGHEADGRDPSARAKDAGYDYCVILENIAYHYDSRGFETEALARKIVAGWEASPLHRENMLDPRVTQIGVGVARSPSSGYYYSVEMLGLPRSASVTFEVRNESEETIRYRIGRKAETVPARSIRTHEVCLREPVRFDGLAGGEAAEPRRGDRFVIAPEGDRVRLQRR